MSVQIKKIVSGRKRFIKTAPLKNPDEWASELLLLKDLLFLHTSFQIVGTRVYLESFSEQLSLMLEVVGVPLNPDQKTLKVVDRGECEVFVYEVQGQDLFNLDLQGLLAISKSISMAILKSGTKLTSAFHIVFDNEKIELHFFSQKDYIENLL